MKYDDLIVLIPSHSLEDFPTELDEEPAAGLLNAFAVLWHPALLASAKVLPSWQRADAPPDLLANRLVIVPTACEGWLPHGWVERARGDGAIVVTGEHAREPMLRAALEPLASDAPASDSDAGRSRVAETDLAGDFLALGSCYLQLELLTRHMHHFSNFDEVYLQREAVAAAEAALADDAAAAHSHLKACYEVLLEARERFYPVECFLIDLCLVIPRLADEHLVQTLAHATPLNLVASAADLREIHNEHPEISAALRHAWHAGTADVCGGDLREAPLPLLPLASVLWEFAEGRRVSAELFDKSPTTWGRRRYGLSVALPQILHRFGFHSALHIVMDDGIYPDTEQSKIRWEGVDGTVIDAISRIPLAADAATSYLRFARRLSESMEQDHVAALMFARWPEVKSPFFEDLRRTQAYAPVLGRFVTLDEFFRHTDDPGRLSSYQAREYLTPFLIQAVARREADPLSRFADHFDRRLRFDAARWCAATADVLAGGVIDEQQLAAQEREIELVGAEPGEEPARAEALLAELIPAAARKLADTILLGAEQQQAGLLVLNPLSFPRTLPVELPAGFEPAAPADAADSASAAGLKVVQTDDRRRVAVVSVPAAGYAWVPAGAAAPAGEERRPARRSAVMAEELVLRNEFFEVYLNESTGGIARIKGYGRSPNRLSQQLSFRFPAERTVRLGDDEDAEIQKTWYSEMRCSSIEVTSTGPALGEIVTTGALLDPEDRVRIADYRQIVRVWRGRPVVEIELELELHRLPEGNPWLNYYAARFAWNDEAASLTRSVQEGAQSVGGERIESPHYLEIATEEQRTTILPCGLPFHRKSGARMLDTLLVVEGETRRRFRLVIAIDEEFPMQAALDAMSPVVAVPTRNGPPRPGASGWFFHLDSRSVQLVRVGAVVSQPSSAGGVDEQAVSGDAAGGASEPASDPGTPATDRGFAVRLVETEGRQRQVRLRCFRTPEKARQVDFTGRVLSDLTIQGEAVRVDLGPYEIADVELWFGS